MKSIECKINWGIALTVLCCTLYSGSTVGLGLGEVEVHSALGRPLVAELPLLSANSKAFEATEIRVQLASLEAHQRAGLKHPRQLAQAVFEIVKMREGNWVVKLTTASPIIEPFITFLVELDWGAGHLIKETTLLLDLPAIRTSVGSSFEPFKTTYGPVKQGETLSSIAVRLRRDRGGQYMKWLWTLYEKNPQAFGSNMNMLMRDAVLDIPSVAEVRHSKIGALPAPKLTTKIENEIKQQNPVMAAAEMANTEAADEASQRVTIDTDADIGQNVNAQEDKKGERDLERVAQGTVSESSPAQHQADDAPIVLSAIPLKAGQREEQPRMESQPLTESMMHAQNKLPVTPLQLDSTPQENEKLKAGQLKQPSPMEQPNLSVETPWMKWILFVSAGLFGGLAFAWWKMRQSKSGVHEEQAAVVHAGDMHAFDAFIWGKTRETKPDLPAGKIAVGYKGGEYVFDSSGVAADRLAREQRRDQDLLASSDTKNCLIQAEGSDSNTDDPKKYEANRVLSLSKNTTDTLADTPANTKSGGVSMRDDMQVFNGTDTEELKMPEQLSSLVNSSEKTDIYELEKQVADNMKHGQDGISAEPAVTEVYEKKSLIEKGIELLKAEHARANINLDPGLEIQGSGASLVDMDILGDAPTEQLTQELEGDFTKLSLDKPSD